MKRIKITFRPKETTQEIKERNAIHEYYDRLGRESFNRKYKYFKIYSYDNG